MQVSSKNRNIYQKTTLFFVHPDKSGSGKKDRKNNLNQRIKDPASGSKGGSPVITTANHLNGNAVTMDQSKMAARSRYSFNEETILVAFLLVILTLIIITFAMFKLAGSIGSLSERLYSLENLLHQHYAAIQCLNQPNLQGCDTVLAGSNPGFVPS